MTLTVAVLRVVVLVQIALIAGDGLRNAVQPGLYQAGLAMVAASSAALLLCTVWDAPPRWIRPAVVVDSMVSLAALVMIPLSLNPDLVVGTWENWAPAFAVNAGMAAWVLLPRASGLGISLLMALTYLVVAFGQASDHTNGSIILNAVTYPGFALAGIWFTTRLRTIGDEADTARAQAIEATRALERERYRLSVHDATTILRLLGDPDTPDPVVESLRHQALGESHRLRLIVDEAGARLRQGDAPANTLGSVLDHALEGFEDLPLVRNTDLGDAAVLPDELVEPLTLAVRTLLHNVRRHAHASQVHVHADAHQGQWQVEVRDNGVGFDAARPLGFGLRRQVIGELEERSVDVELQTTPGDGTVVTMTGPLPQAEAGQDLAGTA